MRTADLPTNEQDRLNNLYSYELLDTLPEKDYDDITKLASHICQTPVSLVTLLDKDRQWFKSAHGLDVQGTSRELAFCSHAILRPDETMVVPDAEKDERFFDNPLVTGDLHVMFYAGVPLLTEEGYPIGSLCVVDNKPRQLDESQLLALKILANQTMRLMQLHKKTKELSRSRQILQEVNSELERFAQTAAENIKLPCDNAIEFTGLIADKFDSTLDADDKQLLSLIKYSCENIKSTIDTTLQRTERISALQDNKSLFTFTTLMQELKQQLPAISGNVMLAAHSDSDNIYFFKNLLLQVMNTVVSASFEFNTAQQPFVDITYKHNKSNYIFTITDNGKGIPVFSRSGGYTLLNDNQNNNYTDKLNTARKIITTLSGSFEMSFEENKGTHFIISVPG